MKPVNLIPARRLIARQRRRHVRRCVVICASWTGVIAGVCVVGLGMVPDASDRGAGGRGETPAGALPARLERAAKEVETGQQNLAAARDELAAAQATLRATRALADQPDWSTLLALIGRATGDDVLLRTFELQPRTPAAGASSSPQSPAAFASRAGPKGGGPAAAAAAKPGGFVVSAAGLAQSQLAVTQFVLRLEQIGLFSKVTLLDTGREPFRDGDATSFRVECVIDPAPPTARGTPATKAPPKSGQRENDRR